MFPSRAPRRATKFTFPEKVKASARLRLAAQFRAATSARAIISTACCGWRGTTPRKRSGSRKSRSRIANASAVEVFSVHDSHLISRLRAHELFMARLRSFDQSTEDGARGFVLIDGALRMPLHRKHEMVGRSSFERFDDAIIDAARRDAEIVADRAGRLVMRRVHGDYDLVPFPFLARHDLSQLVISLDLDGVSYCDRFSGFVIHARAQFLRQKIRDVLD